STESPYGAACSLRPSSSSCSTCSSAACASSIGNSWRSGAARKRLFSIGALRRDALARRVAALAVTLVVRRAGAAEILERDAVSRRRIADGTGRAHRAVVAGGVLAAGLAGLGNRRARAVESVRCQLAELPVGTLLGERDVARRGRQRCFTLEHR